MAIECMAAVINARLAPWKHGEFLVLLMMANYADADGTNIFPSVDRLARACRMKVRGTQTCIQSLLGDGVLILEKSALGRKTNLYRIDMDRVGSFEGCKKCGGAICDERGCKKQHEGVQKTVRSIDDPSGPVIKPSGGRGTVAVDGRAAPAPSLWSAVERHLGSLKFTNHCAGGSPALKDGQLVVTFDSEFRAARAQEIVGEIERGAGVPVVIRCPDKLVDRRTIAALHDSLLARRNPKRGGGR